MTDKTQMDKIVNVVKEIHANLEWITRAQDGTRFLATITTCPLWIRKMLWEVQNPNTPCDRIYRIIWQVLANVLATEKVTRTTFNMTVPPEDIDVLLPWLSQSTEHVFAVEMYLANGYTGLTSLIQAGFLHMHFHYGDRLYELIEKHLEEETDQ